MIETLHAVLLFLCLCCLCVSSTYREDVLVSSNEFVCVCINFYGL